jgi:RHS repeat-associated protein
LTTEFAYNGLGDRVAKTVNGVTTDYVLDPAAGLTQVLQGTTDGQTQSYLYGHDLLAQHDSGTWAYHVNDGLGSVRQLVDPSGQVVQSHSFSPFGVPLGESGGEPYGFTGEQWDASAGLVFLRARYYQPATGRFLGKDPFLGYAAFPQTQHPYVYVGNNPVNLTDPSGKILPLLAPVLAAGVGALIGGAIGGISYALTHRGEEFESGAFWRAVGISAAAGAVSGLVGFGVAAVLPAAGSVWGAMGAGVVSGSLTGGAGQVTANVLNPCVEWHEGLPEAMLWGGVTGGIGGGVGWKIGKWWEARKAAPPSSTGATAGGGTRSLPLLEPPQMHKHHIFPRAFRDWFTQRGIDIDLYTVELSRGTHLAGVHGQGGFVGPSDVALPGQWNPLWQAFKDANPGATAKEIYQFAGQLMDQFGLSGLPIVPYY